MGYKIKGLFVYWIGIKMSKLRRLYCKVSNFIILIICYYFIIGFIIINIIKKDLRIKI